MANALLDIFAPTSPGWRWSPALPRTFQDLDARELQDAFFFHADAFRPVLYDGRLLGILLIRSDLEAFNCLPWLYAITILSVLVVGMPLALPLTEINS